MKHTSAAIAFDTVTQPRVAMTMESPASCVSEQRLNAKVQKYRDKASSYASYIGQLLNRAERAEHEVETLRQQLVLLRIDLAAAMKDTVSQARSGS